MITKNANVISMWKQGKNARNHRGSLESRDGSLFSYLLKIGHRHPNGATIVADFTANSGNFRSMTTSCHVNLARQSADETFHPLLWKTTDMHEEVPF
tara:strand:- start:349 stop:639 length:291 start_codon:yes stop_codon:yes gene_type:complete